MEHSIDIDGKPVPVRIRTNARARRLIVRVEPTDGQVVIVAPSAGAVASALKFAQSQKQWIADRLEELPAGIPFTPGSQMPVRGRMCFIDHCPKARRGVWMEEDLGGLRLCVSGEAAHVPRRVMQFLKREARSDLADRVKAHTDYLGLGFPRVCVRDTATRWGSCSTRSGLSFSWRLIFAPPFVLDYVAAHEVAHLKHMNHSKSFWALVGRLAGDVAPAHRWLAREGAALHRYGRS